MNIPDEHLWIVFQSVYEPGSRLSIIHARQNQPDVLDGLRAVAEWARKEALREQAAVIREVMTNDRVILVEHHRGYTVENYSNPLVPVKAIEAVLVGGDKTDD